MLKTFIIALVVLQLVNCKTIHKRQTCDPGTDLTRVAGTCNKFHRCFNGYYSVVTCSAGYEFDPTTKSCRPDEDVDCVSRGNECGDEMNYARVDNDCRKYFRCINGFLSVESCEDGLVYNGVAKACDWPKNVGGCESYYRGNECDDSIDLTRSPNDCTKFRRCDRGWLRTEDCPEGLVFDNNAKVCNWPNLVPGCEYTFWGNECDSSVDYTRVANDCRKFYLCDRGWLKTDTCQEDTVFDNNAKVCNWPEQVAGCERYYWGNECDMSADLTRVDNDCSKYYRCVKGHLSVETCPNGLLFDRYLKRCEWSPNVKCGITCTANQDLTQVPNDCSRFYKCRNGALSTETCPSGYLFDRGIRACNVAFLVNTCDSNPAAPVQTTPAPVQTTPAPAETTPAPAQTFACTVADNLSQVQGRCDQYYLCANGQLTTETCPTGMNFDRALRACNVASQVFTCY